MASEPNRQIDPITLTVIWNSLISIAEEMSGALRRTAFSEAVREGEDFSTGIFDPQARLIAQGNNTPGHLGASGLRPPSPSIGAAISPCWEHWDAMARLPP